MPCEVINLRPPSYKVDEVEYSILRSWQIRELPEAMADCYLLAQPGDPILLHLDRLMKVISPEEQAEVSRQIGLRRVQVMQKR